MKPQRMCAVCREMKSRDELYRIVKTPDGVILDIAGKTNGRGAYICKSDKCISVARKRSVFERSLSTAVDKSVYDKLEELANRAE